MHGVGLVNCLVLVFVTGPGPWSTVRCGLIDSSGREHHRVDIGTQCPTALHGVSVGLAPRVEASNCFRWLSEIGASSAFPMS
jgi:hypothetical protein